MQFQFGTVGLVIFLTSFPRDSGEIIAAFEVKHLCGDYSIWPYKVTIFSFCVIY